MPNKKILLIMPKYYGYEIKIRDRLIDIGYDVDIIFENLPTISYYYRLINVYFKKNRERKFNNYYYKQLKQFNSKYEVILVIRGETITPVVLQYLKNNNPQAVFLLYQWDSVVNNPNALKIAKWFNRVYSFDMKDAQRLNWKYRPLFYCKEAKREKKREYNVAFISTIHSDRLIIFNILKEKYKDLNSFFYLFSPKLIYVKQKYINTADEFVGVDDAEVKFKPIDLNETMIIYSKSDIIIDFTHPNQNGFTMRTIESIGSRCKLITNNKNIYNSNFYNPKNIYVYEGDDFNIPNAFVDGDYEELPYGTHHYYSLEFWLREILEK